MFAHILMPVDASAVSTNAIQRGVEFAQSQGAKITALHVSPTYRQLMDEGYLLPEFTLTKKEWEESMAKRARAILDPLVSASKKAGIHCDTVHVYGNSDYAAIVDTANKNGCDVIVMGSHGYGAVKGAMLGSVTTRVLSHTKLPVLVIR